MPAHPAPLPDVLGDVFSCGAATAAGVGRRRLRARDLTAPHRGVRMRVVGTTVAADDTMRTELVRLAVLRRVRAYAAVMPAGAIVAGRSALALHDLPLERLRGEALAGDRLMDGTEDLCVGVFPPGRAPRARGVRGMQLSGALTRVRVVDGIVVTSPATTWAMLARELDVPALVRLGDAIVRIPRDDQGRPEPGRRLATVEQLRVAALVPFRRNRARLLAALERIRVGSSSPLETDWRLGADDAGLPEFDLDVEIRNDAGRLLGIADAVNRRFRTIVEIEGDHHRTSRQQWERDIEKHAAYVAAGWEVVRLTGSHIRARSPRAPGILRDVLLRRGWHP